MKRIVVAIVVTGMEAGNLAWCQEGIRPRSRTISADLELTHTLGVSGDGPVVSRSTAKFMRDESGRTRLEMGNSVTINDAVAGMTLSLVLSEKRADRFQAKRPDGNVRRDSVQRRSPEVKVREMSLGVKTIEGLECLGTRIEEIIPAGSALGNERELQKITEVWSSRSISLPVLVKIQDALAGTLTSRYTNIRTDVVLDQKLFQVPEGFEISDASVSAAR
jgi:hypothetical protein